MVSYLLEIVHVGSAYAYSLHLYTHASRLHNAGQGVLLEAQVFDAVQHRSQVPLNRAG